MNSQTHTVWASARSYGKGTECAQLQIFLSSRVCNRINSCHLERTFWHGQFPISSCHIHERVENHHTGKEAHKVLGPIIFLRIFFYLKAVLQIEGEREKKYAWERTIFHPLVSYPKWIDTIARTEPCQSLGFHLDFYVSQILVLSQCFLRHNSRELYLKWSS